MTRILIALAAALAVAVGGAGAAGTKIWPETIRLPDGFQPEGIATSGETFYVGSIPTGAVYRGNLRTGRGRRARPGGAGPRGDRHRGRRGLMFVAGGETGKAFVYNARTGAPVVTYTLTTGEHVRERRRGRRQRRVVHRLRQPRPLPRAARGERAARARGADDPLTGDLRYVAGFNVNGIEATVSRLILVQSNTGKLFTSTFAGVTQRSRSAGDAHERRRHPPERADPLRRPEPEQPHRPRCVERAADGGARTGFITDQDFDVPTTVDDYGKRLYAVNARFGTTGATARYDVVQVRKR